MATCAPDTAAMPVARQGCGDNRQSRISRHSTSTYVHLRCSGALASRRGYTTGGAAEREVKLPPSQLGGVMHTHTQRVSGIPWRIAAGLLMAALNVPVPALAQQATARPPAVVPAPLAPDSPPRSGSTLDRYFESLRQDFIQLDADLDGMITQRDVDLH